MPRMTSPSIRTLSLVTMLSALGACSIPNTIDLLGDTQPPPEFGRPAWVRTCAGIGGVVGGVIGGVGSIVLLPITWPISELASEGFGEHAADEFLLFPAIGLAAAGHSLFGLPADVLDYTFRRAWGDQPDPVTSYELVPMPAPGLPTSEAAPRDDG